MNLMPINKNTPQYAVCFVLPGTQLMTAIATIVLLGAGAGTF